MKNFLDMLKRNNTGLGFNSNSNQTNEKLLIFGIAENIKNETTFDCDAYIYNKIPIKSANYTGKFVSKEDQINQLDKADFIVINKTSDVDFNVFNYDNGIGLIISEKINEERQNTLESFDFDFLIYDINIDSYNLEEIFKIKDTISNIHSNWILNIHSKNFNSNNLQYIYDIGFAGISIDLSTMTNKLFKNIKSEIIKIEDKKNDKL
ncbi:MAG: hypothetical protein GWO78_02465 [Dehalococcoidales bacterium]|nr:hypothetical protein [Dehalococcoidales bacterium]